ncbi:FkbM family methyltransferase [Nocardioides litoris]|uniref:FkbM family methyltransferase n=1 Tax=Nocardioides litoris TaxID=1926648 RepID=UPI001123E152|nr:FkbM family methyltransferase [Nocardioides litoris]
MSEDPLRRQRRLSEEARDAHLAWLLDALEVDLVLDVGANQGQFGRALRDLGYAGRVVSFEPAAGPRAALEDAAAADPAWDVRPWALGSADAEAELHAVDEQTELGSLRPASDFGRAWKDVMGRTRSETVVVRRLDGAWADVAGDPPARRVLLKLDTQGHDLEAFRGAGDLVRAGGPVVAVLTEVALVPIYDGVPTMTEHLAELAAAGWALAGLTPVSFDPPTLRAIELDALLVRDPASGTMER